MYTYIIQLYMEGINYTLAGWFIQFYIIYATEWDQMKQDTQYIKYDPCMQYSKQSQLMMVISKEEANLNGPN